MSYQCPGQDLFLKPAAIFSFSLVSMFGGQLEILGSSPGCEPTTGEPAGRLEKWVLGGCREHPGLAVNPYEGSMPICQMCVDCA